MKLLLFFLLSCLPYQEKAKKMSHKPSLTQKSDKVNQTKPDNKDDLKVKIIEEMFESYTSKFPKSINITPEEAKKLIDENEIIILDVREKEEYEISMIKNSVTKREFEKNINAYKQKIILVYCTIGYRSGLYAEKLLEKGFDAYNLKGGVLLWSHSLFPFFRNGKTTKKVHVYGKDWNYLNSDYVAIY